MSNAATEITIETLAEAQHPYYCSDSNYYSNEPRERYKNMTDFLNCFEAADIDMNLCFRWDVWKEIDEETGNPTGKYSAEVFLMLQRKGIFKPCFIRSFKQEEVERFVAYAKKHHETLKKIWAPFN